VLEGLKQSPRNVPLLNFGRSSLRSTRAKFVRLDKLKLVATMGAMAGKRREFLAFFRDP